MNLYEMAERCNCWLEDNGYLVTDDINLKAFADLVRADEREKFCAVLRQLHDSYSLASRSNNIRAKGETK